MNERPPTQILHCDRFDRRPEASDEKKLGPLARKGACDSTADRTSGSVDSGRWSVSLEEHSLGREFFEAQVDSSHFGSRAARASDTVDCAKPSASAAAVTRLESTSATNARN
jgi:hypothetical protein